MRVRQVEAQPDLVLFLERGEELVTQLKDFCVQQGIATAVVNGSGRASMIVLEGGPAGRRRLAGPLEILCLDGTIEQRGTRPEVALRVVASREMDTGLELVGGVLLEGSCEGAMLRVFRHVHPGLRATEASAPSWSGVVQASAALAESTSAPGDDEDVMPRVGDLVDHPKFGRCVVKGFDDEHVRIRLDGGRVISLGLAHLSFSPSGELSTGKRLFTIHVTKNR